MFWYNLLQLLQNTESSAAACEKQQKCYTFTQINLSLQINLASMFTNGMNP